MARSAARRYVRFVKQEVAGRRGACTTLPEVWPISSVVATTTQRRRTLLHRSSSSLSSFASSSWQLVATSTTCADTRSLSRSHCITHARNQHARSPVIIGRYFHRTEGSVFGAVSLWFFGCVWNVLETAEQICAKFTRKTCLVPCSDEFEGQGQQWRHFSTLSAPACDLCLVKHL